MTAVPGKRVSTFATALAAGDRRAALAAFVLLLAFYGLTAAGNLSETDDAYAFAYFTETLPLTDVSDPRLMLYHMVLRAAYLGLQGVGLDVSGLALMRAFSVVCAALCLVLLPRLLARGFGIAPLAALATTAAFGLTYGYWRYAVEADVYVPALLMITLVLHLLLKAETEQWPAVIPGAIIAGLAVLFYQPNVVPLFFAFPLLYMHRRRLTWLMAYGAVGAAIIAGGYVLGYLVSQDRPLGVATMFTFLTQRSEEFLVAPLSLRVFAVSVVKAGFAFFHDLASASWLFGWDSMVALVRRVYPNHVIAEEVFTARRAGSLIYVPIVLLPLLLASVVAVVAVSCRGIIGRLRDRRIVVCLVWLGLYAAMVGRLSPASIEAWIMALLPLFLLLGVLVIAPALEHRRGGLLLSAVIVLLAAHNWTGGMAYVQDPADEYDRVKGAWVIREGTPDDLVIITDNVGLAETLRYRSRSAVTVIRSAGAATAALAILGPRRRHEMLFTMGRGFRDHSFRDLLDAVTRNGGRILVFEEFFAQRSARIGTQQRLLLDRLRAQGTVVYDHPQLGKTFVIQPR